MAIVTETIRVVTTGANAGTQTYSVQVNTTTGAGVNPLSVPIIGTAAGSSTVTAFMDSHSLTSNPAAIVWQPTNGQIAVTPVTIKTYSNNNKTRGWPGSLQTTASDEGRTSFPYTTTSNSLVFNQVIQNYPITPFCLPNNVSSCGGGYKTDPMVALQQTTGGAWSSNIAINGTTTNGSSGNFNGFVLDMTGSFVVSTPGTYTFYMNFANVSSCALWVGGGATFSSVNFNGGNTGNPFPSTGPTTGLPIAIAATNMGATSHPPVVSSYITFPTAGIYPFEAVYNQYLSCQFSYDNNSYFQITYLSGAQNQNAGNQGPGIGFQSFPVSQSTAPPAGATPTGALRLTPTGGAAGLKIQGSTDTLTLTVQNVPYTSIPYCPIYEGTAGSLFVYNNVANTFTFQTYNGDAVNTTSAATNVFSITGSNTSGIFSVTPSGSAFALGYNGGAFSFIVPGSQIATTDLTITADDIAWYDGTNKSFDLFTPVSGSGGIAYAIAVDFMTKPTVKSVSPASLNATGLSQAITINLSKPMSPQQQGLYGTGNTVVPTASITGGATFTSPLTPILDGQGYLQGWSTSVMVPLSSTNGSLTLSMTVTGTLTYLSGTTFVTNTVTYITGPVATIPTIGDQYIAPTAVSLTMTPAANPLGSTPQTITGTVYTFDNSPLTMTFLSKTVSGGVTTTLGAGTLSNSYTGTVGGKTAYYKVFTLTHTFPTLTGPSETIGQINVGFTAADTVSGLNVTYYSTTVYQESVTITGGGGGGGCPAVEMYLDEWHQVFDVFEGMGVETLAGETSDYVGGITPKTETRQVQWFDFDTQVCYRLKAANGCEVIVSGSTPVPTLEAIEAHAKGEQIEAGFANEVREGMHVIAEIDLDEEGDRIEWSPLVEVECLGMRRVARVYCGGRNFAAGTKPGRYIYTHNLMPIEPK